MLNLNPAVFKDFHTFSIQKSFNKKKVCQPTDPKNFGHVTGNKAYFSFGLFVSFAGEPLHP